LKKAAKKGDWIRRMLSAIEGEVLGPTLSKVSSFRLRSEVRFFLASPTKNFPKTFIIGISVGVKTWLNNSLVVVVVCHWPCRES